MQPDKKIKKYSRKKDFKKEDFDKIKEEINSILAIVARVKESDIKKDVIIRDRLGIDSLKAMEILAAFEVKFGITIDSADAFEVVTVQDLYELVTGYIKRRI